MVYQCTGSQTLRASALHHHRRIARTLYLAACTVRAFQPAIALSCSRLHAWYSPSVPSDPLCDRTPLVILIIPLGCVTPTSDCTPYARYPRRRRTADLPNFPDAHSAARARRRLPQCLCQRRWLRRAKEGCSVGAATPQAMCPPCVGWSPLLQTCATLEREN